MKIIWCRSIISLDLFWKFSHWVKFFFSVSDIFSLTDLGEISVKSVEEYVLAKNSPFFQLIKRPLRIKNPIKQLRIGCMNQHRLDSLYLPFKLHFKLNSFQLVESDSLSTRFVCVFISCFFFVFFVYTFIRLFVCTSLRLHFNSANKESGNLTWSIAHNSIRLAMVPLVISNYLKIVYNAKKESHCICFIYSEIMLLKFITISKSAFDCTAGPTHLVFYYWIQIMLTMRFFHIFYRKLCKDERKIRRSQL